MDSKFIWSFRVMTAFLCDAELSRLLDDLLSGPEKVKSEWRTWREVIEGVLAAFGLPNCLDLAGVGRRMLWTCNSDRNELSIGESR